HCVGNNRLKVIDKTETAIIGEKRSLTVQTADISLAGGDKTIQTVQNLRLAAGDSILLSCGKTILQMTGDGMFNITC
ncbi:type VI secretion system tip protein VgrG, partial [Escherichia coli]|nr:type VI secretion system tip protein VgrG [Escherichia coli]